MANKIVAIIQARLTSTRFPNKIIQKFDNRTLIEFLVNRVKKSKEINQIVVAIPDNKENKIIKKYLKEIDNFKNVTNILNKEYSNSSCHLVVMKIDFSRLKISKLFFFNTLKKYGIICQFHYIPQYYFSAYSSRYILKNTEDYYQNCLSLPIHLMIDKKKLNYIILKIKNIINKNIL